MTSVIDGSKNSARYVPDSSSTMKLYSAISPSRNDQCVGKTLLICRRSPPAMWYRSSAHFAAPPAARMAMLSGFVGVVSPLMTAAPSTRVPQVR